MILQYRNNVVLLRSKQESKVPFLNQSHTWNNKYKFDYVLQCCTINLLDRGHHAK
jgi:hypothetical protein